MTGFEKYMVDNGYVLTHGNQGEFNTYDNCAKSYSNGKHYFTMGLYAKPTRIGIFHPTIQGKWYDRIPTEKDYEMIKNEIETLKFD